MYFLNYVFMLDLGLLNSSFMNGLDVSTILFEVGIVTGDKMIPTLSRSFVTHVFRKCLPRFHPFLSQY